ncbi:MAG: hypothetical protein A2Z25_08490 [Planctomycetes bacterium RBG_16_55_9]|nr:MAG: hypothetical protein A2Z25_08490 [Planctomycetes bacterium RBG_16_55_9]
MSSFCQQEKPVRSISAHPPGEIMRKSRFFPDDSHVELWRWVRPKIFTKLGQQAGKEGKIEDLLRVQRGVKPEKGYRGKESLHQAAY